MAPPITSWRPLAKFLRRCVMQERRAGRVEVMELRHYGGRATSPIEEWKVIYPPEESWYEQTAEEMHQIAEADTTELGGRQQYVIVAMNEGGEIVTRHPFSIFADTSATPDELTAGEDGSTPTGLVSQAHRHIERLLTMSITSQLQVTQALQQENARMAARMMALEDKADEARTMRDEMLDQKQQREIAQIETVQKMDERKDLFKLGKMLLLPAIGAKQGKAMPAIAGAKELLDSLTEEQRRKIADALDGKQVTALADLHKALETLMGDDKEDESKAK